MNVPPNRIILFWFRLFPLALLTFGDIASQAQAQSAAMPDLVPRIGRWEKTGVIESPNITESSGVAASFRYPDCFWTHNDNGPNPGIFLIDRQGRHLATVQIRGAEFVDWEALAVVRRNGQNLIVIGDVGDNFARRTTCRLIVVPEPDIPFPDRATAPLDIATADFETIDFRYPDGPQDCEAMAVEPDSSRIWLISKQRPGGAKSRGGGGRNGNLERTAIHFLDWPAGAVRQPLTARRLRSGFAPLLVTGMDISPDGQMAVVRTYFQVSMFLQEPGQSWETRMASGPNRVFPVPLQRQGESIGFDGTGQSLILTSEGQGQPVWRLPLTQAGDRAPAPRQR